MSLIKTHKKTWLLLTALIIIAAIATGGWLVWHQSNSIKKLDYPEYLTFAGNYVFSVPKNYVVDEQAINGVALVYSGSVSGQTIDQVYAENNISLQPITFLKDHKSGTFKDYVNNTFVPDTKKVLAPDVTTDFAKVDGWDIARVTVKKDGQLLRFIYLKNGQHPVSIVSRQETDPFKKIEQSVTDVEKTDLKNEVTPLKKAVQNTAQLLKDKNATELYNQAVPDFRSKNSQDNISKLLAAEAVYSQGSITINGGSYSGGEFGAVINFTPLNKDFKPASGALYYQKINGQWQLKAMQLPNPAAYQIKG